MEKKRKIIIYGGTFDPPHKGHFALIKSALEQLDPDAFYIVPGFRSPFKGPPAASFRDRSVMLKLGLAARGLARDKRVKIHPYESDRGRVTYTWRTVSFFKKKFPDAELYFLMGSDCFGTFHRWKNYRRILANARIVVGLRGGFSLKDQRGLPYRRLKGRFPEIASTALKAMLFSGSGSSGLFKNVGGYIDRRGLYFTDLRRRIARLMKPERFKHSTSVTRLALELAAKHGADPEKTAAAALLHDAARDLGPRALAFYALKRGLKVPALRDTVREAPALLHSYVSADLAEKKFGIEDPDVLKAIRDHTLGSAAPGLLGKIIYVSDLAAYGRALPQTGAIRELAFSDLDGAYAAANYVKLAYAFGSGRWLHPESLKVWNSILEGNR